MVDGTVRRVQADSHVTMHYRLRLRGPDRTLIDTFDGSPATFQLGIGQLAEPLERCLLGLEEGNSSRQELAPERAFGDRNPDLMSWVPQRLMRHARRVRVEGAVADETPGPGSAPPPACDSARSGAAEQADVGQGEAARPIVLHGEPQWQVGDALELPGPDGNALAGIVRDRNGDSVLLDFNHPLAGQGVVFEVRILGVL